MFLRLRHLVGFDSKTRKSSRRVHSSSSSSSTNRGGEPVVLFRPPDMLDTVHEIAIYIHRFHNLDLFQQGWYQMKISARWEEDDGKEARGIPSRVVQYEAPELSSDDALGIWKIDDIDNSFHTQPFRIKYARQDVYLSVMVSFNIFISQDEGPSSSSIMLKFELIYAPTLENGSEILVSTEESPAAVHEFTIPNEALLCLHSYCPVHFDALHAVLVDLTLHITYLKAGATSSSLKAQRDKA